MLRYAFDPKSHRLPGLAKNAYLHELSREDRFTMEKYSQKAPQIMISLETIEKKR